MRTFSIIDVSRNLHAFLYTPTCFLCCTCCSLLLCVLRKWTLVNTSAKMIYKFMIPHMKSWFSLLWLFSLKQNLNDRLPLLLKLILLHSKMPTRMSGDELYNIYSTWQHVHLLPSCSNLRVDDFLSNPKCF